MLAQDLVFNSRYHYVLCSTIQCLYMECAACINTDAPTVFQYLPNCDAYLHNVCFVHFTSWMEDQACLQRSFRAWQIVAQKRFAAAAWHRRYLQRVYVRRWALHTFGRPGLSDSSETAPQRSRLDSSSRFDASSSSEPMLVALRFHGVGVGF